MLKRAAFMSLLAGFCFGLSSPALGQKKPKEEVKKVKSYDFSGDDIDGDLVKPDGDFVDTRSIAKHTTLIRIRKDFIKEILKSAEDL